MSYTIIITAADVIARMSLPDHADVTAAINAAFPAAHAYLQGIMDTAFEPVTETNSFYIDSTRVAINGYYRLRLKHAFVDPTTTVTVKWGETKDTITTTIPMTDYYVDNEKGLVHLSDAYALYWISVTYTAGLNDTTNQAPIWLKEAALTYMPEVLNTSEPTNRNAEMVAVSEATERRIMKILDPHMRGLAFHIRPAF